MPCGRKPYFSDKKIGGKTFKYHTTKATKREAQASAENLRKKGYNARVTTDKDWGGRGYNVFKRKKG